MANTITKTILEQGERNLTVLVNILGDGSGDYAAAVLIDRSDYPDVTGTKLVVNRIQGLLGGFAAALLFDATADLPIAAMPADEPFNFDWHKVAGVASSKAGAGYNGDILLTTTGLGAGERGTFTLFMRKGNP